jgi:hypothetical protein
MLTVLAVAMIMLAGILLYLLILDKRLKKIESHEK